jgi:AcrR family transcriptional regulator
LTQILEESGAPKGSFYFHFPGGKEQIARDALMAYGARVEQGLKMLASRHDGDAAGFVKALCETVANDMKTSGWSLGCLAQNLASELAPLHPSMSNVLEGVFQSWIVVISAHLRRAGFRRPEAERSARALVAALEGARTLARAARTPAPFDAVAWAIITTLKAEDASSVA